MDPLLILKKYYNEDTDLYKNLVKHSRLVAEKALSFAQKHPELSLDLDFVQEAAMLHDIGVFQCHAPSIGCHGTHPYLQHGYRGAALLRSCGYPRHALVCERHTGTGLSKEQILAQNLPLPAADFLPISLEEKLICFADKFYSKSHPNRELSLDEIRASMARFGKDAVKRLEEMINLFV